MRQFAAKQNQPQKTDSVHLARPRSATLERKQAADHGPSLAATVPFVRAPQSAPVEIERGPALQRGAAPQAAPTTVPPIVHEVLRSSGQPLDAATRAYMEPRFGYDFSKVRVHADTRAAEAASSIDARAFTSNRGIVFGAGEYAPQTEAGRRLLSHEFAHVVQQGTGVHLMHGVSEPGDLCERHADTVENEVMRGHATETSLNAIRYRNGSTAQSIMRQPALLDESQEAVGYIGKVVDQYGRAKFLQLFALYNPHNYSDKQDNCIRELENIAARNGEYMNMKYFETFLHSVGMHADPELNPQLLTYTMNPRLRELQEQVWEKASDRDQALWTLGNDYQKKKLGTRQEAFLKESVEAKGFTRGEFFEWILYGLPGKPEKK